MVPFSEKVKKSFGVLEKKVKFQETLTSLGRTWEVTPEMFTAIQGFICAIYGSIKKTINEVRFKLVYQKCQNQNKIVDMSTLPPWEQDCFSMLSVLTILPQFGNKKRSKETAGIKMGA